MAGAVERTGGICPFERKLRSWSCFPGEILTAGNLDLVLGGVASSLVFSSASFKFSSSLSKPAALVVAVLWLRVGVIVL